jgi:bifunctional aspartokinase / homoserine dehydrogenase 1
MIVRKNLRVMKFGGTSVGDAECIRRVAAIIAAAALQGPVVAVTSAMSGVTDRLIQAARCSATGDTSVASEVSAALRQLHLDVLNVLVSDPHSHSVLAAEIDQLSNETSRLCLETAQRQELTPRLLDAITSIGERLSTRLVAGALQAMGKPAVVVEATELIITNDLHGRAEPLMDHTRERARARLLPLLNEGAIPVVTGFIGATTRSVITTLGRGGSDYSATILGAVLKAKEVVLWKDVNGILTADPRVISEARNQPSLSYREATDLALFGAKALHLKTLQPVMAAGIPVQIRNSFASENPGTTITSRGQVRENRVKAVASLSEACLIAVRGWRLKNSPDVISKRVSFISELRTSFLPLLHRSAANEVCFISDETGTRRAVKALRNTFGQQLEQVIVTWNVAVVAVIGDGIRDMPKIASRLGSALESEGIKPITIGRGTSASNICVVIETAALRRALAALHREFRLGELEPMPPLGVDYAKRTGNPRLLLEQA